MVTSLMPSVGVLDMHGVVKGDGRPKGFSADASGCNAKRAVVY